MAIAVGGPVMGEPERSRLMGCATSDQDQALEIAELCHDLAVVLAGAADLLHERAATILAALPTSGTHDRKRVDWAVELAADL